MCALPALFKGSGRRFSFLAYYVSISGALCLTTGLRIYHLPRQL